MISDEEDTLDLSSHTKYHNQYEKIDSFVIKTTNLNGTEQELPDSLKFMAAFYKPYRRSQIEKTKYGDWRIHSRSGNYTIRLFDTVKLHSISFKAQPAGFDCSIKQFRILFAKEGKVFQKSKIFQLEQNNKRQQVFQLADECTGDVDAVKIEVLSNWGSVDSTCLFDYSLYKKAF